MSTLENIVSIIESMYKDIDKTINNEKRMLGILENHSKQIGTLVSVVSTLKDEVKTLKAENKKLQEELNSSKIFNPF